MLMVHSNLPPPKLVLPELLSWLPQVSVQLMYAYAFFDASLLMTFLREYSGFADPIHLTLLYADTTNPVTHTPNALLMCSCISILLLALQLKNDNNGRANPARFLSLDTVPTSLPINLPVMPSYELSPMVVSRAQNAADHMPTRIPASHTRIRYIEARSRAELEARPGT